MDEPLYREYMLEHARHPRGRGELSGATHRAVGANPRCGDRCSLAMIAEGDTIVTCRWQGEGCALMTAALSVIAERFSGATVASLRAMTDEEFLQLLGVTVSSGRLSCALVPLSAARSAFPS